MSIENLVQQPILHAVYGVKATIEELIYQVDVEITDMAGQSYRCDYLSRPEDTFGLAPTIRGWLIANEGSYVIAPYVPPANVP